MDKLYHYSIGFLLYAFVFIAFESVTTCYLIVILVAITKELIDKKFSWMDLIVTILGGVTYNLLYEISKYFERI